MTGTVRFSKLYAVIKWGIIATLAILALAAAVFWTMILGGFAGSGFRAAKTKTSEDVVVTPECAWPYNVNEADAMAVCRLFYNLTPEQRAEVLKRRASPRSQPR